MSRAPYKLRTVFHHGIGSYVLYTAAVTLLVLFAGHVSLRVANGFVASTVQRVDDNPRPLSRVERHFNSVARAALHRASHNDEQIVALTPPSMPPIELAAALDRAESADQPPRFSADPKPQVRGWTRTAKLVLPGYSGGTSRNAIALANNTGRDRGRNAAQKSAKLHKTAKASIGLDMSEKPGLDPLIAKFAALPAQAPSPTQSRSKERPAAKGGTRPSKPTKLAAALLASVPLPSQDKLTTPGEIIRVSLLGPY